MGNWTLTCPSEGVYTGECFYYNENGVFRLVCPVGVKEIESGCPYVANESPNPVTCKQKQERCILAIKESQTCPRSKWGSSKECVNPYAVCKTVIPCK